MTPELIAEAAAWISMLTNENCTDQTKAGFAVWLMESDLHVQAFLEAKKIWMEAGGIWPTDPAPRPKGNA
jgi:ferric-dicitrate binding protein FerR (iron transport regulator)